MTADLSNPADDIPAPFHRRGPDTEREAAQLIAPKAGSLRTLALNAFRDAGEHGLTDGELAEATRKYLYSIAPRRVELARDGWVEDSGERRKSHHGRNAVVWRLTAAGQVRMQSARAAS